MKILKKRFIKIINIIICALIIISLFSSISVFALTPSRVSSTELRNQIATNWIYKKRGYIECNCLGWVLGRENMWIWPWGKNNPTVAELTNFLKIYGYKYSGNYVLSAKIYAFGTSTQVTHVARGLGVGPLKIPMDAKWGQYEVFNHRNTDPYTRYSYGPRVATYS